MGGPVQGGTGSAGQAQTGSWWHAAWKLWVLHHRCGKDGSSACFIKEGNHMQDGQDFFERLHLHRKSLNKTRSSAILHAHLAVFYRVYVDIWVVMSKYHLYMAANLVLANTSCCPDFTCFHLL